MIRKLNHAGMALFVFLSLSAVALWMTGNLHVGRLPVIAADEEGELAHGHEEPGGEEGHSEEGHNAQGEEAAGATDLAALEERKCEHGVRTVDCDNCRFELGVVKLQPLVAQALISTGSVEEKTAAVSIRVMGEIQRDPTRVVEVPPVASGRVTTVKAFLGQTVREGEVLAVIHSSDFGEAKAAFLEAHAHRQLAQATLDREKGLFEKKISSEADYLNARKELQAAEAKYAAAEKRLHLFGLDHAQGDAIRTEKDNGHFAELILRAPRDGTIVKQNLSEGKVVDASESLCTIADLSTFWVWCDVYERDLAALHEGLAQHKTLEAVLRVAAFPDRMFRGTLDLLDSEMDEHTRTVKARVRVADESGRLRPGMFADVELRVPVAEKHIVVLREAVLSDEGRRFVFQHWKDDLWVRRDVRVGREIGAYVEVLGGVSRGATIVTAGAFMLKSDVLRAKMGAGCAD